MTGYSSKNHSYKGVLGDMESFVDHISDVLQCPITIEDANHRLIAYSTHDERTDPARIKTIIGRRVPEKIINSLWKNGVIPALLAGDEPLRVKSISEVGLGSRVAISIRKNKEVLGFIWALEVENPLAEDDLVYLQQMAQLAKNHLLQLQIRKQQNKEGYQEFYWKLLTGHMLSKDEIDQKFFQLQLNPPKLFSIIVFQFESSIDHNIEKNITYILTTSQRVKIIFYTIDYNKLILFTSPKEENNEQKHGLTNFIELFIKLMKERFNVTNIIGSAGHIYDKYEKVETSYREALNVLDLKERYPNEMNNILSYQDIGIYQYFDILLEKKRKDGIENHSINKLVEYDRQQNNHLLQTLEAYLDFDGNINETAKHLHIHVNTLSYRLKRISAIGDINLKDPNQKLTLYIEMKLSRLM
ncbi:MULTISPECIES: PucR family transcriptional regulator [Bacillaceae]|uniref:PucR family transcriptional regulator n=1 Tax=Bacillaceae TaxID=186817 RepID=UPI002A0BC44B|nr:PucR family transcriptional regulator [Cytobacillus sp. IB215316]MDX8362034.1 PucR family transcriptional regulator [Cytobacillus sp. IB215316]